MTMKLYLAEPVPNLKLVTGEELNFELLSKLKDSGENPRLYYAEFGVSLQFSDIKDFNPYDLDVILEYWTASGEFTSLAKHKVQHRGGFYGGLREFMMSQTAILNSPSWVVINYDATLENIKKKYVISHSGMVFTKPIELRWNLSTSVTAPNYSISPNTVTLA